MKTHRMCGTPTYWSWLAMRVRCKNPKNHSYKNYGGRGIAVCEQWESFETFLCDMGERPEGMTIDRIDLDGNYEPGNCRWATAAEQAKKKRSTIFVTVGDETLCLKDWCRKLNIRYLTVYMRISRGASHHQALGLEATQ